MVITSVTAGSAALGLTEFVPMGLLPQLASDLVSEHAARDPRASEAASRAISGYALGVVVGIPVTYLLSRHVRSRELLVLSMAWCGLWTVLSASSASLSGVVFTRFVSGLPHAMYFGAGTLMIAQLLGPNSRARAGSYVLLGLVGSNLLGVPLLSAFPDAFGWRAVLLTIGLLFFAASVSIWFSVGNRHPSEMKGTIDRTNLTDTGFAMFGRREVVGLVLAGSFGFAGFFALYSYVAPIALQVHDLQQSGIVVALVVAGAGMTVGVIVGGRFGDRHNLRTIMVSYVVMIVAAAGGLLFSDSTVVFYGALGALSFGWAMVNPPAQSWLIEAAVSSPRLAAATHHGVFNVANAIGPSVGGLVIAARGYEATYAAVFALTIAGSVLTLGVALSFKRAADRESSDH